MIYVGIDPGVHTGMAVWDTKERALRFVATLSILEAMSFVKSFRETISPDCEIFIEDARLRKWLPKEKSISEYRGKMMGAGSVKRDCEIWEEFAERIGVKIHKLPPRPGATKWDADYFKRVTGWQGRTSNHARDAAVLVFNR